MRLGTIGTCAKSVLTIASAMIPLRSTSLVLPGSNAYSRLVVVKSNGLGATCSLLRRRWKKKTKSEGCKNEEDSKRSSTMTSKIVSKRGLSVRSIRASTMKKGRKAYLGFRALSQRRRAKKMEKTLHVHRMFVKIAHVVLQGFVMLLVYSISLGLMSYSSLSSIVYCVHAHRMTVKKFVTGVRTDSKTRP